MPARSHDSRLVRRLLRSRKRGGQIGADNMEKAGSRRKDSALAAAKDIHQKVAAGECPLNAFPYARAIRGRFPPDAALEPSQGRSRASVSLEGVCWSLFVSLFADMEALINILWKSGLCFYIAGAKERKFVFGPSC